MIYLAFDEPGGRRYARLFASPRAAWRSQWRALRIARKSARARVKEMRVRGYTARVREEREERHGLSWRVWVEQDDPRATVAEWRVRWEAVRAVAVPHSTAQNWRIGRTVRLVRLVRDGADSRPQEVWAVMFGSDREGAVWEVWTFDCTRHAVEAFHTLALALRRPVP